MPRSRTPLEFVPARLVGVAPVQNSLGITLDVCEDRLRYRLPAADAQRLLEDLLSLLVVGKAEAALASDNGPTQ